MLNRSDFELAFAAFENLYFYDWYAQPDGGCRSVIFSFSPKSMSEKVIKIEAESLEKAFNYALIKTGCIYVDSDYFDLVGVIRRFSHENWNQLVYPDSFWSLQDNCWKNLKEVLEAEKYAQAN